MREQIRQGRTQEIAPALLWLGRETLRRTSQRMGGPAPEWVQIFPYGTYVGELEGERFEWVTDEISQESCVDFFNLRGNDLVIDYEHLSDKDVEAPAAGRIIELRAGGRSGLLARVEWTERARAQLESGEYYYDSPSFFWSRNDKRIYGLRHLALTNNPGSWNRPYITDHSVMNFGIERTSEGARGATLQLVCAVTNHKERRREEMESQKVLDSLRKALKRSAAVTGKELRAELVGLIEEVPDTDERVFVAASDETAETTLADVLGERKAAAEEPAADVASQAVDLTPIRLALGVDSDDPRELALAVMSLKGSSVPHERVRELEEKLAAAETRSGEERIALDVARQRKAGKQITPAFEAELVRVAKSDYELALSSLNGLQVTSIDLTTQSDAPAATVERLETARQRAAAKVAELPPGTSVTMQKSTSDYEATMAIVRERFGGEASKYDEANALRLEALRAAA